MIYLIFYYALGLSQVMAVMVDRAYYNIVIRI